MTELEAFEQEAKLSGPFVDYSNARKTWHSACKWQRSVCNEELVMLRQRVAELEMVRCTSPFANSPPCRGIQKAIDKLEPLQQRVNELEEENKQLCFKSITQLNELAALKQQGEPVGYFVNVNLPGTRPNYQQVTDDCAGDSDVVRLYTAPPTCFSSADMADAQAKSAQIEREECAKIVENADTPDCGGWNALGIADAIRARSCESA